MKRNTSEYKILMEIAKYCVTLTRDLEHRKLSHWPYVYKCGHVNKGETESRRKLFLSVSRRVETNSNPLNVDGLWFIL